MSSDLLDKLIRALTVLPGVGKKSAQRMALYLLDKNKSCLLYTSDAADES